MRCHPTTDRTWLGVQRVVLALDGQTWRLFRLLPGIHVAMRCRPFSTEDNLGVELVQNSMDPPTGEVQRGWRVQYRNRASQSL
eukprot:1198644-Amphidinium_carterae.2